MMIMKTGSKSNFAYKMGAKSKKPSLNSLQLYLLQTLYTNKIKPCEFNMESSLRFVFSLNSPICEVHHKILTNMIHTEGSSYAIM